eukprot:g54034.t1
MCLIDMLTISSTIPAWPVVTVVLRGPFSQYPQQTLNKQASCEPGWRQCLIFCSDELYCSYESDNVEYRPQVAAGSEQELLYTWLAKIVFH